LKHEWKSLHINYSMKIWVFAIFTSPTVPPFWIYHISIQRLEKNLRWNNITKKYLVAYALMAYETNGLWINDLYIAQFWCNKFYDYKYFCNYNRHNKYLLSIKSLNNILDCNKTFLIFLIIVFNYRILIIVFINMSRYTKLSFCKFNSKLSKL